MSDEAPKPNLCPNCGEYNQEVRPERPNGLPFVRCLTCLMQGPVGLDDYGAIDLWNLLPRRDSAPVVNDTTEWHTFLDMLKSEGVMDQASIQIALVAWSGGVWKGFAYAETFPPESDNWELMRQLVRNEYARSVAQFKANPHRTSRRLATAEYKAALDGLIAHLQTCQGTGVEIDTVIAAHNLLLRLAPGLENEKDDASNGQTAVQAVEDDRQ